MSTQQKSGGGGRKTKSSSGAKDGVGVAVSEQNNNQTQTNSKKHNNVNAKDTVNNNTADQPKTEKEKPHVKVSVSRAKLQLDASHWRGSFHHRRNCLLTVKTNLITSSFSLPSSLLLIRIAISRFRHKAANSRTDSYRSDYRNQKWSSRSHTRKGVTVDGDDRALRGGCVLRIVRVW